MVMQTPTVQDGADAALDSSYGKVCSRESGEEPLGASEFSVYDVIDEVRQRSSIPRIRSCCSVPCVGGTSVRYHEDATISTDLARCDDQRCPHCARWRARVDAARTELILIEAARRGLPAVFATFTYSNGDHSPDEQFRVIDRAIGSFSTFTRTRALQEFSPVGSITRFESTHRPLPGGVAVKCHLHAHTLFFFETNAPVERIGAELNKRWRARIDLDGEQARASCQKFERVDLGGVTSNGGLVRPLALYIGGATIEKLEGRRAPAPGGTVAQEMSHEHVKRFESRRDFGGVSLVQFARHIMATPDSEARAAYWRYYHLVEQLGHGTGKRGRSFFRISHRLFEWFATEEESGGDRLMRLARERIEQEDERVESPVVEEVNAPLPLMTAIVKAGVHLPSFFRAIEGTHDHRPALWGQFVMMCERTRTMEFHQRQREVAFYAELIADYVAYLPRGGPERDSEQSGGMGGGNSP